MNRLVLCFTMAAFIIPASVKADDDDTPKAAATRKVLKTTKITVEFENTRLEEAMEEIKEKAAGFKFLLDTKGGVSRNQQVTFKGKDKTVEEVLAGIFAKNDLGYVVISVKNNAYDGLVKITKGGQRGYEKGKEPK